MQTNKEDNPPNEGMGEEKMRHSWEMLVEVAQPREMVNLLVYGHCESVVAL